MNLHLLRETLRDGGRALVANRLRSLLALLGIVIGVGTVIGMVALINGFQRSFQQSIQSLGNNTIYIRRIRPGIQFSGGIPDSLKQRKAFTMDDAAAILAQRARGAARSRRSSARTTTCGCATATAARAARSCYGTNQDYLITHGYDLARGRFFTGEEVERRANVVRARQGHARGAVQGRQRASARRVHIGSIPFTVIGEFESKGRMLGNNFDEVAAVPYSTIDKYFPAPDDAPPWFPKRGELFLDAIAASPEQSEEAQRQIIEVLRDPPPPAEQQDQRLRRVHRRRVPDALQRA